ncbi:peptide deformylase [Kribbella amoyensis]|uniref:Peptide deformylase n=1 Tax=Kribbella amoyensis TaxID=996641 RepID=A0A561BYE9_9ACTN|nr:peptide deformylase [Kribbella amoyensis]TWD83926.1 peptide deformylase [Kribbella amoyensis]
MPKLPENGSVLPITRWGEDVMHRLNRPVTDFGDDLHKLVADMVATMRAAEGVGLAANQVGVDLQVFVFDCPDKDGQYHQGVVCNPSLDLPEGKDRRLDEGDEGCLSLPGAFTKCARPDFAKVTGVDEHGNPVTYEGTGLLARCLQHETDHTQGMVFGDRLSRKYRKRLYAEAEEFAPDYPTDWPVSPMNNPEDHENEPPAE